jgi:hypothetical protein
MRHRHTTEVWMMDVVFELPAGRKVWHRGMKGSQPQTCAVF